MGWPLVPGLHSPIGLEANRVLLLIHAVSRLPADALDDSAGGHLRGCLRSGRRSRQVVKEVAGRHRDRRGAEVAAVCGLRGSRVGHRVGNTPNVDTGFVPGGLNRRLVCLPARRKRWSCGFVEVESRQAGLCRPGSPRPLSLIAGLATLLVFAALAHGLWWQVVRRPGTK